MGIITLISTFSFSAFVAIVALTFYIFNGGLWMPAKVPQLESEWWGIGEAPATEDTNIRSFKIDVSDQVIKDLHHRLDNRRITPASLIDSNFTYGFNSEILQNILSYWRNDYKWKIREEFLNKYPQFVTNIQGLDIHFLHIKPKDKSIKALPLLLLHDWPGSIREFYGLIEILNNPQNIKDNGIAFEIIAPSLPGYGWSSATTKKGMGPAQMAVIFKNLMKRLGHDKWYVQGGDWGSAIGSSMAILFPENIKGFHCNMCFVNNPGSFLKLFLGSFWPSLLVNSKNVHRMYPLSKIFAKLIEETGYMHIQATKPDTVGTGLNDSPAGK